MSEHDRSDRSPDRGSDRLSDRNEDPQKMGGAVGGVTGGAMVGGLALGPLGPIGAAIGALAGALGGWWAGEELVEAVEDMDKADNRLRRAHEHAGAEHPYEEVRHAYQLGYLAGRNPRYSGAAFTEIEQDLHTAWTHAHRHDDEPVQWEDVRAWARNGYGVGREAVGREAE